VKDGRVYDHMTGPEGLSIEDFKNHWETKMTSTSVFDYKRLCKDLIYEAIEKPTMFYKKLQDFEAVVFGHQFAFEQLKLLKREDSFDRKFCNWLDKKYGLFCSCGWAKAVNSMASHEDKDENEVFSSLVNEFFKEW
jgi:hypothetical protein